jgi:hypothetical protein
VSSIAGSTTLATWIGTTCDAVFVEHDGVHAAGHGQDGDAMTALPQALLQGFRCTTPFKLGFAITATDIRQINRLLHI